MSQPRDFWSSPTGFVLATIGAAVGLGSIWKFPYEVGANGGGAFVFLYLIGLVLIVFPLVLVEFAIGRRGRADAVRAIEKVASEVHASPRWAGIGFLGVAASFIILSFYSVIAGWAISYLVDSWLFGLPTPSAVEAQIRFDALLAAPLKMAVYHFIYLGAAALIVGRGISRGIENACKILMPVLIFLILVLAFFSMMQGDTAGTLRFLFRIDPNALTVQAALDALGLGFFSIGVGLSLMITYAAHADAKINLQRVAVITILGDTAVSLAAGFAIFPIVFAEGLDPASGPGLLFVTLPLAFTGLPGGTYAALGFFLLLIVAALASGISMLEMPVSVLTRRGWSRGKAVIASATTCGFCGLATVFSFNVWASWYPLAAIPIFSQATVYYLLDHLTSNIMLPLGGIALALFAGWRLPAQLLAQEIGLSLRMARLLQALLRYFVAACIAIVALFALLR